MAVYTSLEKHEVENFIAQYNLGPLLSYKGIKDGIQNTNYFIETEKGRFVLTIFEASINRDDLPFFLDAIKHLHEKGIPCPIALETSKGQNLLYLKNKPSILVPFLEGRHIEEITVEHCSEIGKHLAKLHVAGKDFTSTRKNSASLEKWDELFLICKERANEVSDGLSLLLEKEIHNLKENWPENLPQGIIHADLFPNNVFFEEQKLSGLIDFYFSCTDFTAYDLAICINAWCFDKNTTQKNGSDKYAHQFNIEKAASMLKSYQSINPLTQQEINSLPIFLRGSALRFLLTRLHDFLFPKDGIVIETLDPKEYIEKLKFHQNLSALEQYGLAA